MLIKASATKGYQILASDGSIGTVSDLLFDDARWTVRWLVVETGNWLMNRQVLVPASALGCPDVSARALTVHLTKAQVKDSPDVDTRLPVSRQHAVNIYDYYGTSPYWGAAEYVGDHGYWIGMQFSPPVPSISERPDEIFQVRHGPDDPHLRSIDVMQGDHIHATDGEIGHLADVLLDEADCSPALPGGQHQQLVAGQRGSDLAALHPKHPLDRTDDLPERAARQGAQQPRLRRIRADARDIRRRYGPALRPACPAHHRVAPGLGSPAALSCHETRTPPKGKPMNWDQIEVKWAEMARRVRADAPFGKPDGPEYPS